MGFGGDFGVYFCFSWGGGVGGIVRFKVVVMKVEVVELWVCVVNEEGVV